MATKISLDNAIDPGNHHTKFENYCWFYKNQANFPSVCIVVGRNAPTSIQTYGKSTYFYKVSSRLDKSQTWCGDYPDQ